MSQTAIVPSAPPLGEFLSVDGKQVHLKQSGDGPVVVLVHGASGNLRDFDFDLIGRLEDRYRVIAFDRPGLGYSDPLHSRGETPQEQARHMARALDKLGIEQAVIVGHSFGGAVALAWALERPDQVAGVVTLGGAVNPWPGGLGPWYTIASSSVGGATVVPLLVALVPRGTADGAVRALFSPNDVPQGYVDFIGVDLTLRAEVIRQNARQVNNLKAALEVMQPRYSDLTIPVEALHGRNDRTVPANVHSIPLSKDVQNGTLTLLEGVGHMPHHAAPDAVVEVIDRAVRNSGLR